ncbi:hypothetical protein MANES_11G096250v8 [Manihot esculenta]|uniref:Uncharacterized protein n=1 Tax=Manihot esculenta TaxID=3983 RepID=A0ACB7GVX5_MANES|nr:hypothetical protein MANES_11G096250v8 [Manihot esculenta]
MLEELSKRLAKLGIKEDTKMKAIASLTMELEEEEVDLPNKERELIQLESMLQETEPAEVNRIKYHKPQSTMDLKPYYPRPSPINLQYEDMNYNPVQVDGSSIIEWNIDGLSDYQIKNVLQYMTMHATACRSKGNDDPAAARALIAGFSGQLKGWWDFSVSNEGKIQIFNMVKQEGAQQVPDVVNTLLYTIGLHFIGSVNMFTDRAQEQLINLRCPDLSHFKWYKDTFFSLVFTRVDSQNNVWKEKFLAGLPALFAERVRDQIRSKHNGNIPYHDYTYGELASEVVTTGIYLCNELKIHKQMQKERFYGKQILGNFCEQREDDDRVRQHRHRRTKRFFKDKRPYKEKHKRFQKTETSRKPKEKRKPNQGKAEKTIVCYRCGKALTIEESIKEALAKILLNETDSEQEVMAVKAMDYTTEEEESSTEEEENQKEDCEGNCDYYKSLCTMNGLLVLTKEDNLILDLIDNIEDPEKKREKLYNTS